MERWFRKTAVVTGANGGIGSAVTLSLANKGLNVVGVDLKSDNFEKIQSNVIGSGRTYFRKCDVANSADVLECFEWIKQTLTGVDVLVNNAGIVYHGNITEIGPNPLSVEELLKQIDVNVKSVILCSRQAISSMYSRTVQGQIINLNSIIGHCISTQPIFNTYCASKYAITALTKTLLVEVNSFKANVKISSISPSLVRTEMACMSKMPELAADVAAAPALLPEDIANVVLYILSNPPHVNIDEITVTPVGEKRV